MSMTDELYQQVILEHNRNPKNFGTLDPCSHSAEGFNPVCGDHYTVSLNLSEDATIAEVNFDGTGCAISKASASMMTQALIGLDVLAAKKLFSEFHNLVTGKLDPDTEEHSLGKLTAFSGIWKYPARVKCAGLCWHTLNSALSGGDTVCTE